MKSQLAAALAVTLLLWLGASVSRRAPPVPGVSSSSPHVMLLPSWRLWFLLTLCAVVTSLVVGALAGQWHNTTLGYAFKATSLEAGTDSWAPMIKAIRQLRERPDAPLYRELFFAERIKFQYPVTALPLLDLTQRFTGATWESLVRLSNGLGALSLPLLGLAVCALLMQASAPNALSAVVSPARVALFATIGIASVGLFSPITKSFVLGQVQTQITLAVALALLAWQQRRHVLAGILMGVCCTIKPQWLVVVPWAILRRQWEFVIAMALTVMSMGLLAWMLYGYQNFLDYVPVVKFLGNHGESQFANQSMNGLMNRLLFNGNNIEWVGDAFPPFHPVVHSVTLGTSALLLGAAFFWRMGKAPSGLDLSLIVLSATMASPIAWDHHYGVLLPIFALLVPASVANRPLGWCTVPYVTIAFLLVGQRLDMVTSDFARTHWNVVQSSLFLGAILVLLLLYRITSMDSAAGGSQVVPPALSDRTPERTSHASIHRAGKLDQR